MGRKVPDNDLFLSPWMKFKKYGKMPYKLLLNLLLCFFLAVQLSFILSDQLTNERQIVENIKEQLGFNNDDSLDLGDVGETIHTTDEFIDRYYNFISAYRQIDTPETSLLHFMSISPPDVYITRSRMYTFEEIESLKTVPSFDIYEHYVLTDEYPPGYPFSMYPAKEDLHRYTASIKRLVIAFRFGIKDRHFGTFDLGINATFTNVASGYFDVNSSHEILQIVTEDSLKSNLAIISIAVIIIALSVANFFLILRSMFRRVDLIMQLRAKYPHVSSVRNMSITKFIDSWIMLNFVSAILNVVSESFFIMPGVFNELVVKVLFSIALFFAFFVMTGYFEWSVEYYGLTLTVARSIKDITLFLIGQSPIFFAFVLSGTVFFGGETAKFRNVGQTSVTLFALLNGDSIRDSFDETYCGGKLGRIYTYAFIVFFIFAAVNVFLSILRSEYSKHQEAKQRQAQMEYLKNFPVHLRYKWEFMEILRDLQ